MAGERRDPFYVLCFVFFWSYGGSGRRRSGGTVGCQLLIASVVGWCWPIDAGVGLLNVDMPGVRDEEAPSTSALLARRIARLVGSSILALRCLLVTTTLCKIPA